jgi:hypothetical protein
MKIIPPKERAIKQLFEGQSQTPQTGKTSQIYKDNPELKKYIERSIALFQRINIHVELIKKSANIKYDPYLYAIEFYFEPDYLNPPNQEHYFSLDDERKKWHKDFNLIFEIFGYPMMVSLYALSTNYSVTHIDGLGYDITEKQYLPINEVAKFINNNSKALRRLSPSQRYSLIDLLLDLEDYNFLNTLIIPNHDKSIKIDIWLEKAISMLKNSTPNEDIYIDKKGPKLLFKFGANSLDDSELPKLEHGTTPPPPKLYKSL